MLLKLSGTHGVNLDHVVEWTDYPLAGTATARPEADPVHARPSMQPASNDEANIPTARIPKGIYWRSTQDLAAGMVRLGQQPTLDELEAHGVIHPKVVLSEGEFCARVQAAMVHPAGTSGGGGDHTMMRHIAAALTEYLTRLQVAAQAKGYRFAAGATGVQVRQNPEDTPHQRPEGSQPSWAPKAATTGVNPGSRYVINAAADLHLGHAGTGDRIRGPVRQSQRG